MAGGLVGKSSTLFTPIVLNKEGEELKSLRKIFTKLLNAFWVMPHDLQENLLICKEKKSPT